MKIERFLLNFCLVLEFIIVAAALLGTGGIMLAAAAILWKDVPWLAVNFGFFAGLCLVGIYAHLRWIRNRWARNFAPPRRGAVW